MNFEISERPNEIDVQKTERESAFAFDRGEFMIKKTGTDLFCFNSAEEVLKIWVSVG